MKLKPRLKLCDVIQKSEKLKKKIEYKKFQFIYINILKILILNKTMSHVKFSFSKTFIVFEIMRVFFY